MGDKNSIPLLLNGLERLEYREYDSDCIAIVDENSLKFLKRSGKVESLYRSRKLVVIFQS